jgi:type IV pilus assembly protein PilE
MTKCRVRGFTLVELMITVVIVAILASIALPAYSTYVQQGKINEALANLSADRVRMEQWYLDTRDYSAANGPCTSLTAGQYFTSTCLAANLTATTYVIDTSGIGSMAGFEYRIDQANNKTTVKYAGTTVNATCWWRKQGTC